MSLQFEVADSIVRPILVFMMYHHAFRNRATPFCPDDPVKKSFGDTMPVLVLIISTACLKAIFSPLVNNEFRMFHISIPYTDSILCVNMIASALIQPSRVRIL